MTTTLAPEAPAEAAPPRRLETEIEPLNIPAELQADSLVALVHNSVLRNPDKEALRWKLPKTKRMAEGPPEEEPVAWTSTSYRQTWDWITQVAMGLKHLGIRDGDRVCIMSRTRPAWLAADLGSLSLGAVTCPIYPSVEPKQAAFVINNVGARLIFVENLQQAAKIDQVRAECPTLEHVVVIDDRGRLPDGAISFDDIFDLATADPGEIREWTETWSGYGRDKVATIVHTSGTTANPKGVVLTHGNILHNFEGGVQAVDFNENDLFLSFLPLSHMTERAAGQIVPLGRGCTIAYAEPAIERLAANMAEVQADRHGRRAAPLRAPLRARHLDGRGRPAAPPADLRLGAGAGSRQVRQPRGGPAELGLAAAPAEGRRSARLPQDQGPHRRSRPLLRLGRRPAVAGDRRVLLSPWGC